MSQLQEQITRMAFDGVLTPAVAADLHMTSTLSEILRKGQRRIMQRYFQEHRQY